MSHNIEEMRRKYKEMLSKTNIKIPNSGSKTRSRNSKNEENPFLNMTGYEYNIISTNPEYIKMLIAMIPNNSHFPTYILRAALAHLLSGSGEEVVSRNVDNIELIFAEKGSGNSKVLTFGNVTRLDNFHARYNPRTGELYVSFKKFYTDETRFKDGTLVKGTDLTFRSVRLPNPSELFGDLEKVENDIGHVMGNCKILVLNNARPNINIPIILGQFWNKPSANATFEFAISSDEIIEIPTLGKDEQFWMMGSFRLFIEVLP